MGKKIKPISRDERLALLLSVWFDQHESDRNRWRNPVGRELKARLSEWGNFKLAPRGTSPKP